MSSNAAAKPLVKFAPKGKESFYDAVKKSVDEYFRTHNITEQANNTMRVKTAVMLSLYFVPYLLVVTGMCAGYPFLFYLFSLIMGLGIVGIGASVMHDSNHGSYSKNKIVNSLLGNILNVIGGYSPNWRIQHNILHHTYTNIDGLDDDIDAGILLRFSPNTKKYWMHRFQHIYAWFLYGLLTLQWATIKDFRQVYDYHKKDLLKKEKTTLGKAMLQLSIYKILYYTYIFIIPVFVTGIAWQYVLIGFLIMHFTAGLLLSCIFQLAHVMGDCEFPMPNDERKMENNWAVHQLLNTANFSPRSKMLFWFIGGLNHQIEHHLFPHICHVHYKHLAVLVKQTAAEYGLPYYQQRSFVSALAEHTRTLRRLGKY